MSICIVCGNEIHEKNSLDKKKCIEGRIHQFFKNQVASVLIKSDFKVIKTTGENVD